MHHPGLRTRPLRPRALPGPLTCASGAPATTTGFMTGCLGVWRWIDQIQDTPGPLQQRRRLVNPDLESPPKPTKLLRSNLMPGPAKSPFSPDPYPSGTSDRALEAILRPRFSAIRPFSTVSGRRPGAHSPEMPLRIGPPGIHRPCILIRRPRGQRRRTHLNLV